MNIETIIQNCGTYIVIGQAGEGTQSEVNKSSSPSLRRIINIDESVELSEQDYLNATTAGHIGHFAGNPAHASIHTDFNRVIKILDVTADEFTPENKHVKSHQK